MVKKIRFYETKNIFIIKKWTFHEREVHIKKKGRVYEFLGKERLILRIFGSKGDLFQRRKLIEGLLFLSFYETCTMSYEMKKLYFSSQKKKPKKRQNIFFRMEYRLLIANGPLFWILWGWKTRSFLAKTLMEIWCILITEKFLFWNFLEWKIQFFLRQKVVGKMIFPGYWKVLVFNFLEMKRWKDHIYWLLKCSCFGLQKSSCFELFSDGKYGLFFSQNVDVKIIFTLSFWAFHDIPGPGRYGFSGIGN